MAKSQYWHIFTLYAVLTELSAAPTGIAKVYGIESGNIAKKYGVAWGDIKEIYGIE